jgi:hypothetical protein
MANGIVIDGEVTPLKNLPYECWKSISVRRGFASAQAVVANADDPFSIPVNSLYEIESGERGAEVFGIQRGLNGIGWSLVEDGIFGDQTLDAVKTFQYKRGLGNDGVFGPKTSEKLSFALIKRTTIECPDGLIRGMVEGESGNLIGAVNWTVAGGVDCSYCQRRVYSQDFSNVDVIKKAFDGRYQMNLIAKSVKARHDAYFGKQGANTNEKAWRLGILYHNYEVAADKIAEVGIDGLGSYWTTEQGWVVAVNAHFDDGASVKTPLEWCQFYSLGSAEHNHPGRMTKYIKNWTV